MRHSRCIAFVLVLVAGSSQGHADLVTYNMTGTLFDAQNPAHAPFANGDKITWTLQYDRSTPLWSSGVYSMGSWHLYGMQQNLITNLVDQSSGYHFPLLPAAGPNYASSIQLSNYRAGGDRNYRYGSIFIMQGAGARHGYNGTTLDLVTAPLRTLNLADFQFKGLSVVYNSGAVPSWNLENTHLQYFYEAGKLQTSFYATVNSIPGAFMIPEPSSLALFLLGAAGLAARGMRRLMGRMPADPRWPTAHGSTGVV